jgi:universal stress protein A
MKTDPNSNPAGALLAFNGQHSPSATCKDAIFAPPLFRLDKVLVPIDFSELSKKALGYAVQFANHKGGRIVLLNVLEPLPRRGKRSKSDERDSGRMDESERRLLELGEHELGPAPACDLLVQMGKPYRQIVNAAKALSVDLIVMATRGCRRIRRPLKPRTAELVVRLAPCPVLVVRSSEQGLFRPSCLCDSPYRKAGPNVERKRL